MKVYALISIYFDQCDFWENIIDLYSNYDDALMQQIVLEQDNTDADQSWSVSEMSVK